MTKQKPLDFIDLARTYLGQAEIPGAKHNAKVVDWWKRIGAHFRDDETPWCGAFVGGVLNEAGYSIINNGAGARNWLKQGSRLEKPAYGAIVVFWRGSPSGWSGHVGFVVGQDERGNLMVLGGNQSNKVTIEAFSKSRVLGYRWASGKQPLPARYDLPTLKSNGKLSTNEA